MLTFQRKCRWFCLKLLRAFFFLRLWTVTGVEEKVNGDTSACLLMFSPAGKVLVSANLRRDESRRDRGARSCLPHGSGAGPFLPCLVVELVLSAGSEDTVYRYAISTPVAHDAQNSMR